MSTEINKYGYFNGDNFRSVVRYEPTTEKACALVEKIWISGGLTTSKEMFTVVTVLLKTQHREEFRSKDPNDFYKLLQEADDYISQLINNQK